MEKLYQKAKEEGYRVLAGKTSKHGYKRKTRTSSTNHPENITKPKGLLWMDWNNKSKWMSWT
jgi:hypothetical protein